MAKKKKVPKPMVCSKNILLVIAGWLHCNFSLTKLSVTSKTVRELLQCAALIDNDSELNLCPLQNKYLEASKLKDRSALLRAGRAMKFALSIAHRIFFKFEQQHEKSATKLLDLIVAHGDRFKCNKIELVFFEQ